jgi:hypothetical protein
MLTARFSGFGVPDSTFGEAGRAVIAFSEGRSVGQAIAFDAEDRIVVAGNVVTMEGGLDVGVARLFGNTSTTTAPGVPVATSVLTVVPNPVRDRALARVRTTQSGPHRVVVVDVIGREVAILFAGTLHAGIHHVPIPVLDLPSGTYAVRSIGPDVSQSRAFTVTR